MNVLILANGEPPSRELAQRLAAVNDLLIATDGAAHLAVELGVTPDIICGDFDSVDLAAARVAFPQAEFVATPDQSYADLEKALQLVRSRGAGAVTIIGAAGGRIDHLFANYALLLRYGDGFGLTILDDRSQVWAVSDAFTFPTKPGDIVSVIVLESGVLVSISGVQWELREFALAPGTRGVSNVATGEFVTVEAQHGKVLVCHLHRINGGQP